MSDVPQSEVSERVVNALDEYLAAAAAGTPPDRNAFLARYPELAEELAACLESMEFIGQAFDASPPGDFSAAGAPGVRTLGDFQLVREVGRGGMGVVYEARQLSLDRRVALKVLPFAGMLDPRQLQRFKNEAQAAAQLEHPHIVDVIAVGCDRGVHYYAMRFIEGQTLAQVIGELKQESEVRSQDNGTAVTKPLDHRSHHAPHDVSPVSPHAEREDYGGVYVGNIDRPKTAAAIQNPIPARRDKIQNSGSTVPMAALSTQRPREYYHTVARMIADIAEALDYAHQVGVIHRDVKPSNILVDARGNAWITDFGLAQIDSRTEMTLTGDVMGTLPYMSPEQATGQRQLLDHRTDVYSLGAMLYELVTLERPFEGAHRAAILHQIAHEEPARPRVRGRAIPAELECIILKALEKAPTDRYASAGAMADDLRRFVDERPIQARRSSLVQRAVKWSRRHTTAVAAATLVLLIGLMAATGLLWRENAWTKANLKLAEDANHEQARLTQIAQLAAKRESDQARLAEKAREQAEQEKRHAEEEKRIADAVRNFLQNELRRQADSYVQADSLRMASGGFQVRENPTIKELLDRAAAELTPEKIERRFPGLPRVQAEILGTIGETYQGVGDYREAISHLTRAVEILGTALGDNHLDTLVMRRSVATAYLYDGKLDVAIPLYKRTLKEMEAKLGDEDQRTVVTRRTLGDAYCAAGKLDLAISLLQQTLDAQEAALGDDHPETLIARNCLAIAYFRAGEGRVAIPLFERTLKGAEATLGDDHPITLGTRSFLGALYVDARKPELAIPIFEAILAMNEETRGPDHPDTVTTLHCLAIAYVESGQRSRGLPLLEQVLKSRREKLGPDHPGTLDTQALVGAYYSGSGRPKEGVAMVEEAVKSAHKLHGGVPDGLLFAQKLLGDAYVNAGLLDEAAATYRAALDDLRRARGGPHATFADQSRWTFSARNQLGLVYWWQGKYDQAELVLSELLAEQRVVLGNEDHNTLNVMDNLAKQYREQRKFELAVPLFEESLEGKRRVFGNEHPSTLNTVHNLGTCYLAAGDPDKAMPLLRESFLVRQKNALNDWFTFNAQSVLGGCLCAERKYNEAEPLLVAGYEGMKQRETAIPPTSRIKLPETLERLVQLYAAWEKPDEAAKWRAANPVSLAHLAASRKQHRKAVELFREALAARPELASDPLTANRYNAACAAALAADGQGADAADLDAETRTGWRSQAREWLRADLEAWKQRLANDAEKARPTVLQALAHWQQDSDLDSVRDEQSLAKLPVDECASWQEFWHDVAVLLESASTESASRTASTSTDHDKESPASAPK
jgi:eukaryotic-like serine/threonine-protein kinase